jgi:hypothetical protein
MLYFALRAFGFLITKHKHKSNNLLFSLTPLVLYSFSPLPYSFIHLPAVFAPYFSPFPSLSVSHFAACVRSSHYPRVTSCTFSLLVPTSATRYHFPLSHTLSPLPIVLRFSYSLLLLANFLQFLLFLIPSKPVPVYLYFPVSYFHHFSSISLLSGQLS